jgi:RNA polymerase sigma-70 factor (ECF subfamily)
MQSSDHEAGATGIGDDTQARRRKSSLLLRVTGDLTRALCKILTETSAPNHCSMRPPGRTGGYKIMFSPSRQSSLPMRLATMTPPQEADDATLVHRLVDEHPDAARLIWRRFAPMVHRILRRSLGPDDAVEDLAQEVFLCVFRKAPTLRDPQSLRAFVIAVTAFAVSGERRRRWLRRPQRWEQLLIGPGELVTKQHIEQREALRRLLLILDRITVEDRTAFALRFIQDMPLDSVATALGVSVATAKRRVSRAFRRVALRVVRDAALEEYLPDSQLRC